MKAQPTLTPSVTEKHTAVTILEHIYQSQCSQTIHYTYDKRLEGLRCCEIAESVCTHSILVWNVGALYRNFHPPLLTSRGIVTVVEDEFQSPPCSTIHYTYDKRLEGLRCYGLPESVITHTIWVQNVSMGQANSVPTQNSKIGGGDHFSVHIPISTMSNHSLYL